MSHLRWAARFHRVGRRPGTGLQARFAVLIGAVIVLTGCGSAVAGTASPVRTAVGAPTSPVRTAVGAPTSGTAPADIGPVPKGLQAYYQQRLSWQSCADYAQTDTDKQTYATPGLQCARLKVPVSYGRPGSGDATIGVLKAPTTGEASARIGSVVFNPGGPGGSGMSTVGQFAAYGLGADLREHFDLIGFDPRGVGASRPVISCRTGAEFDADRKADVQPRTPADVAKINDMAERSAQDCTQRTGRPERIDGATFLGSIGSRDVARDMDVLRAVLGDRKLSYVGYSAGTRLGTSYAEQFPGNVRAMILDGAIDPNSDDITQIVGQGKGFQDAFVEFAKWCAGRPDCALGSDPANAPPVFQRLVRPLLDKPLPLPDGRVLSYDDATTGVVQALYSDSYRDTLAKGLSELAKGTGTTLMQLADSYYDRDASGHYSNLIDAFSAIGCMDNTRQDPAKTAEVNARYLKAAPFLDPGFVPLPTKSVCDFWPSPPTMTPHSPKVPGLAKVLVISTLGDPATPYQAGVELAKDLGGALLTVAGSRHTAYLGAAIACADTAGTAYLVELTAPAEGAKC